MSKETKLKNDKNIFMHKAHIIVITSNINAKIILDHVVFSAIISTVLVTRIFHYTIVSFIRYYIRYCRHINITIGHCWCSLVPTQREVTWTNLITPIETFSLKYSDFAVCSLPYQTKSISPHCWKMKKKHKQTTSCTNYIVRWLF